MRSNSWSTGNKDDGYKRSKQIRLKTSMLQSGLYHYNRAYILVKRTITFIGENNRDGKSRSLVLKNNAPFTSCTSKISNLLTDNADDLDVVMSLYNLIEYSRNYKKRQFEIILRLTVIILYS